MVETVVVGLTEFDHIVDYGSTLDISAKNVKGSVDRSSINAAGHLRIYVTLAAPVSLRESMACAAYL